MKSLAVCAFALAIGVFVPFATGCAEEQAEGAEAAYPVGATVPPPEPPPLLPGAQPPAQAEAPPASGEDDSGEVVVGDDTPDEESSRAGEAVPEDTDPSSLTDFRATLDPYGTWVDDGT